MNTADELALPARLTDAIAAVAPIHGVSIENADNRATWRVDFTDDATDPQRAAAQKVIDEFDPTKPSASEIDDLRKRAYMAESDALGMKLLARIAADSDLPEAKAFSEKRNEIKIRHPRG